MLLTADIPLGKPDDFDGKRLRNIWGREARLIVRSTELMASFEQTREYIVCI